MTNVSASLVNEKMVPPSGNPLQNPVLPDAGVSTPRKRRQQDAVATAVTSTPVVHRRSHMLFTSTHYTRDARMAAIGEVMKERFAGSMPPSQFLDIFLPKADKLPWNAKTAKKFGTVCRPRSKKVVLREVDMYTPMIHALKNFCPNLTLVNTSNHASQVTWGLEPDFIKPDLIAYSKENLPPCVTDVSKAEIIFKFKLSSIDDGFYDVNSSKTGSAPFEHASKKARDTRNQITSYVTAQLATQFRTFVFSVLIIRDRARLIRWDRSGATVSQAFDYVQNNYLADFFWRYNHASPECRGVDTTVTVPGLGDASLVERARKKLKLHIDEVVLKFEVTDDKTKQKSYYFGGKPCFSATASPTGRCTHGIRVVDENGEAAFLKDTWRIDLPHVKKEGEIYEKLHNAKVRNIPTVLACGDVLGENHRTFAYKFHEYSDPRVRWQPHQHYRLVFREVGRDLTSFKTVWEVINAMADAIEAHKMAYEQAGILHRDISVGNILITNEGKGLLIDWDLCKGKSDKKPRRAERTGTWQFMSASILLSEQPIEHVLADDLESFFYVLVWITLRFTPHKLDPLDLTRQLTDVFDYKEYNPSVGISRGGAYKRDGLKAQSMQAAKLPDGVLQDLVVELESVFRVRYLIPLPEKIAAKAERSKTERESYLKVLETSEWLWEQFHGTAQQVDKLQIPPKIHVLMKRTDEETITPKTDVTDEEISGRPRQQRKISPTRKVPVDLGNTALSGLNASSVLHAKELDYASEYEIVEEAEEAMEKESVGK